MTALEKRLLTNQIILLHYMRESFRICSDRIGIKNARYDFLEYEENKLISAIKEYLKDFGLSDQEIDSVIKDDIKDQLSIGQYSNIISAIELVEKYYIH